MGVRAAVRPGMSAATLASSERRERDERDLRPGHGGLGDGVDVAGEEDPEPPADADADRRCR